MIMSFTMNWKIMIPDVPVRFDAGEPLFQIDPAREQRLRGPGDGLRHLSDVWATTRS